jgi:hypothetical protein
LFKVSKDNARLVSILTYGLDYDLSILKNKNYFISESQILKNKDVNINQ